MTTIAYRDGLLVADSRISAESYLVGASSKMVELPGGHVFASAGTTRVNQLLAYRLGRLKEALEIEAGASLPLEMEADLSRDSWSGILVRADGVLFELEGCMSLTRIDAPFYAFGSGQYLALGAMAKGADALEAVRIAAEFDLFTGPPFQMFRFPRAGLTDLA